MKHFLLVLLLLLASCTEQKNTNQSKSTIDQVENKQLDSSAVITDYDIIFTENAPTRITRNIKQDKEGNILIAAYEAVIRHDGNSFTNITQEAGIENCYAFDVLEDRNRNIWIASDQMGAFRIDPISGKVKNFTTEDGLAARRNMCILEDKAGKIWIGGNNGLSKYDGASFSNLNMEDGLTNNDVNTIMEDSKGNLWIGTRGTACIYDGKTFKEILNEEGKPFKNVWSIIEDKKGDIWLNGGGLWRYDGTKFTLISPMEGICIYEDRKGNIWFNPGHTGLYKPGISFFEEKSLGNNNLIATPIFQGEGAFLGISEDREGHIWIGGDDGVWFYDGTEVNYYTGISQ